jgi:hypothetical protein
MCGNDCISISGSVREPKDISQQFMKTIIKHQQVQLIPDGMKENHHSDWVTFKFTLLTLYWQP